MLDITERTVKQIKLLGFGGLAEFVKECYDLDQPWEMCAFATGSEECRMFDITQQEPVSNTYPYFADIDVENALTVINTGSGEDWDAVALVLARLCYDGHIPQGYYIVKWGW